MAQRVRRRPRNSARTPNTRLTPPRAPAGARITEWERKQVGGVGLWRPWHRREVTSRPPLPTHLRPPGSLHDAPTTPLPRPPRRADVPLAGHLVPKSGHGGWFAMGTSQDRGRWGLRGVSVTSVCRARGLWPASRGESNTRGPLV